MHPKSEEEFRVERALNTLIDAQEIMEDKALMKKVEKLANERAEKMNKVGIIGRKRMMKASS